jgi:hypothetical protein
MCKDYLNEYQLMADALQVAIDAKSSHGGSSADDGSTRDPAVVKEASQRVREIVEACIKYRDRGGFRYDRTKHKTKCVGCLEGILNGRHKCTRHETPQTFSSF